MFERFDPDCRRAMVRGQEHAVRTRSPFIGPEHLLLGILDVAPALVARILAPDTDVDVVRAAVDSAIDEHRPEGAEPVSGPPFTPRAKKVLEQTLKLALRSGSGSIALVHLLAAVAGDEGGLAASVLTDHGLNRHTYRRVLLEDDPAEGDEPSSPSLLARAARLRKPPVQPGTTRGFRAAMWQARELAGDWPLATEHVLRALIKEGKGMAARALDHLGVTEAALDDALATVDVASTSDALASTEVRVIVGGEEARVQLHLGDYPDVADRLRDAIASGRFQQAFRDVLRRERGEPEDQPDDEPEPEDEPEEG